MRRGRKGISLIVIPAKAGIHSSSDGAAERWIPASAGMTISFFRGLCETSAASALKCFLLFLLSLAFALRGWAACTGGVAEGGGRVWRAAAAPEKAVAVTFLGHASFLIESPQGVRIVTDYNDLVRAPVTPDIVTMNNAHTTHWTDAIEP